jgi:hypothetical protein
MVNTSSVFNLINSKAYQEMASKLAKKGKIKLLNIDEDLIRFDVKNIEISGLTCTELTEILEKRNIFIENFVSKKNTELLFHPDTEEYPAGMEVENEEDNEVIDGISPSFLLTALIEFCLIEKSEEALLVYLKKIRATQATKYAKQLKKWHEMSTK